MDQLNPNPTPLQGEQPVCVNCGTPDIVPGKRTALCHACRNAFIRFPIPVKIRLFAAGIGIVFLVAIFSVPKQLKAGIHLERAKAAEKMHNYVTEEKELKQVLSYQPDYTEALAHLVIASYYNQDIGKLMEVAEKIGGRHLDNSELLTALHEVMTKAKSYWPPETMTYLSEAYGDVSNIPDTSLINYLAQYSKQTFALQTYAMRLMNQENYRACDSLLNIAEKVDSGNLNLYVLRIGAKRGLRQFDAALQYCSLLLEQNREHFYGLAAKARTLLQEGDVKAGLALAAATFKQFPDDGYCKGTMALAWHVTNEPAKRDALVKELMQDSAQKIYGEFLVDVINHRKQF